MDHLGAPANGFQIRTLPIIDVSHLREAIIEGKIDVGVLVTHADKTATFITDRAAYYSHALITVDRARAHDMPLIVMGLEHDGPGPALPKRLKSPPGEGKRKRKKKPECPN